MELGFCLWVKAQLVQHLQPIFLLSLHQILWALLCQKQGTQNLWANEAISLREQFHLLALKHFHDSLLMHCKKSFFRLENIRYILNEVCNLCNDAENINKFVNFCLPESVNSICQKVKGFCSGLFVTPEQSWRYESCCEMTTFFSSHIFCLLLQ